MRKIKQLIKQLRSTPAFRLIVSYLVTFRMQSALDIKCAMLIKGKNFQAHPLMTLDFANLSITT